MRISDWSSDVCSSDLLSGLRGYVGRGTKRQIKLSVLVWIFTIAQRGGRLAADRQRFRERLSLSSKGEPTRDHAVIGCRCRISLGRQHATEIIAGCTALFVHFRDQAGIVGGIGD